MYNVCILFKDHLYSNVKRSFHDYPTLLRVNVQWLDSTNLQSDMKSQQKWIELSDFHIILFITE